MGETRDAKLSAHSLFATLEEFGGLIGKLAAAFVELSSAVQHFLAGVRNCLPALLSFLADEAASISPALRSV